MWGHPSHPPGWASLIQHGWSEGVLSLLGEVSGSLTVFSSYSHKITLYASRFNFGHSKVWSEFNRAKFKFKIRNLAHLLKLDPLFCLKSKTSSVPPCYLYNQTYHRSKALEADPKLASDVTFRNRELPTP